MALISRFGELPARESPRGGGSTQSASAGHVPGVCRFWLARRGFRPTRGPPARVPGGAGPAARIALAAPTVVATVRWDQVRPFGASLSPCATSPSTVAESAHDQLLRNDIDVTFMSL